jgi:hypothetical protein
VSCACRSLGPPARCIAAGVPDDVVRRHSRHGDLAFYAAGPPRWTPLDYRGELSGRQGPGRARRAPGPPLVGLWPWALLAMLAHALLAVIAATERAEHPPPCELIALCNGIRHIFTKLIT